MSKFFERRRVLERRAGKFRKGAMNILTDRENLWLK